MEEPDLRRPDTGRLAALLLAWALAAAWALAPAAASAQAAGPDQSAAPPDTSAPAADPSAAFRASPYLEMGGWEYPILDHWIAAGRLPRLSPYVQPYRRMDVARAIRKLGSQELAPWEKRWLERLERELRPELDILDGKRTETAYAAASLSGGATDWTQTSRDPLRPRLHGTFAKNRVLERFSVDVEAQGGSVAGAVRLVRDGIFRHDAQFPDGRVVAKRNFPLLNESTLRFEEAYAEAQTKYARLFVGRMYRNWGPPHTPGFLLSNYAYSWDQIGYRLGSDRIFVIGAISSFNDFPGDTVRYFAVHRLEWRPRSNLMLALSESIIQGGPNARLDWRILNPVSLWETTTTETAADQEHRNDLAQADAWWRPVDGLVLSGSLIADNSTSLKKTDQSCCGIGGTLEIQLPDVAPGLGLRVQGTALQSLVYHTSSNPWERYLVDGVGLGWDKTDLRLGTLEARWFGVGGLVLEPRIDIQQKGESDMHSFAQPPGDSLPGYPRILVGQTETTIRPALAGVWHGGTSGGWAVDLDWDVGIDFIHDFQHVKGASATALVGRLGLQLRTPRLFVGLD